MSDAESKELLIRTDDVQVLHGFDTVEHAQAYFNSKLFRDDVVVVLKPYLKYPLFKCSLLMHYNDFSILID
ncbi:hypothetical protein [Chitinophaga sp.]|uniref:hypothetical protein n=1 Tax=Chitinophaga sp. TaxID=1869181 RepID=UPI002BAC8518|nr:hypothetical protein [Chitinophaga sp.]HWV67519.1 hypothetical protein [Chitinophaga sp.]